MTHSEATPYLFVYGTLLEDAHNRMARYLALHAEPIGRGTFPGRLFDLGAYPGAVFAPEAATQVHGRIVRLRDPEEVLRVLDAYEGVGPRFPRPTEFVRTVVPVRHGETVVRCWVYLYHLPIDTLRLIVSGDYLAYRAGRRA